MNHLLPILKSCLILLILHTLSSHALAISDPAAESIVTEVKIDQKKPSKNEKPSTAQSSIGFLGDAFQNLLNYLYAPDQKVSKEGKTKSTPCPQGTKCDDKK